MDKENNTIIAGNAANTINGANAACLPTSTTDTIDMREIDKAGTSNSQDTNSIDNSNISAKVYYF